jgi:hypothetical protein
VEYLGDFSRRSFRKQQTQNLKFARRQDFDEEFHWRVGGKTGSDRAGSTQSHQALAHGHRRPWHRCQFRIGQLLLHGVRRRRRWRRVIGRGGGWRQGRSCRSLRRRHRRHRSAPRRKCRGRSRRKCGYFGPQVLLRSSGCVAGYLLLAGLELLDAGLELHNLLPETCQIARHRLELRGVRRWHDGGRCDGFRRGRSRSRRLRSRSHALRCRRRRLRRGR